MRTLERCKRVEGALDKQYPEWVGQDTETRTLLFEERLQTQYALDQLGVDASDLPEKIPHINRLFLPDRESLSPIYEGTTIEVVGMPNTGKTSGIKILEESLSFIVTTEEQAKESKQWLLAHDIYSPKNRQLFQAGKRAGELLQIFDKAERDGITPAILMDRGFIDCAVFDRAYFLEGKIDAETFKVYWQVHLNDFTYSYQRSSIRRGFVVCLTTPTESLERQGVDESTYPKRVPPEVMTPKFLATLYEQYLRFHHNAINFEKLTGHPRSFAYASLDMSRGDFTKTQALFVKTVKTMVDYFKEE